MTRKTSIGEAKRGQQSREPKVTTNARTPGTEDTVRVPLAEPADRDNQRRADPRPAEIAKAIQTSIVGLARRVPRAANQPADVPVGIIPGLAELPSIAIVGQGPSEWIENRHAWVQFRVSTMLFKIPVGKSYVRLTIQPKQSTDSYEGDFEFPIGQLTKFDFVDGAISFRLPRADVDNTLTLTWYAYGPVVGEFAQPITISAAEMTFSVGAQFTMWMTPIYIYDTASHHEDTLYVQVNGVSDDGQQWGSSASLGDHNNTGRKGIQPNVRPIGPFTMLPGSSSNVSLTGMIVNWGHSSREDDAKSILDTISKVGAVVATTISTFAFPAGAPVWGLLSAAVDALNETVIAWAFADCDSVVWLELLTVGADDLFFYTFDPADQLETPQQPAAWAWHQQKKKGDVLISGFLGGGCEDSDYQSGFNVTRNRQGVTKFIANDGLMISPGQTMNFAPLHSASDQGVIMYSTLREDSHVDPLGNYIAPPEPDEQKFDVVMWRAVIGTDDGIETEWSDFSVVILE
jgi:hypothetical protein